MTKITGKSFVREDVPLDDHHYERCVFRSCRFIFAGRGAFSLDYPEVSPDCEFLFTEFASNTLKAMQAIYGAGEWGRSRVIATFQEIAPDLTKLH